jgi:hypothetical protein
MSPGFRLPSNAYAVLIISAIVAHGETEEKGTLVPELLYWWILSN